MRRNRNFWGCCNCYTCYSNWYRRNCKKGYCKLTCFITFMGIITFAAIGIVALINNRPSTI